MASTESAIHAVLCRIRDALHSLELGEIESVLGPILTVVGATFDASSGVLQFARPVPAATLCRAFGWRRPYAVSGDLQRWHIALWADDLATREGAPMQEIAVRQPQIGSWNLDPVLSRWPHGDTPLRCGPSPAYDLHSWPAMVSAIELFSGEERACQLDACGWIRIYDLALKRCELDLTFRPIDRRTSHPLELSADDAGDRKSFTARPEDIGRELTLLRLRARPEAHSWVPSSMALDLEPRQSLVILQAMRAWLDRMPDEAAGSATGSATDVDLVDVFLPLSSGVIEATWYLDLDASRRWRRGLGDRVTEIMIGLEIGFVGVRGSSTGEETVLLLSRAWEDQAAFYRRAPETAAQLEGSPVIVAQLVRGDDAFIDLAGSFIAPVRLDRLHEFVEGLGSLMDDIHDDAVTGAAQGVRATTGFTTTVRAHIDLGTGVELRDAVHAPSSLPGLQPLLAWIQRFLHHANPGSGSEKALFTASPSSITSPATRAVGPRASSHHDVDEEALTNRPARRDDRDNSESRRSGPAAAAPAPAAPVAPPHSASLPASLSAAANPLRTARLHGFPTRRRDDPDLTPVRSIESYSEEIRLSARLESQADVEFDDSVESSAPRAVYEAFRDDSFRDAPMPPAGQRFDSYMETPRVQNVSPASPFRPVRPASRSGSDLDSRANPSQRIRRQSSSDDVATPPVRLRDQGRPATQESYSEEVGTRPHTQESYSSYPPSPAVGSPMSRDMVAEMGNAATDLALGEAWERRRRRLWVDLMSDTGESHRVEIDKLQTIVGRAEDCDVVVKDGAVSRRHCSIAYDPENGGQYVIKTLHKAGRMHYLGNRHWGRIAEIGKKTDERAIENGDVLVIGLTQLHFEVVEAN